MILRQLTITVGMTHNLGDYSNIRPEVRLSTDLDLPYMFGKSHDTITLDNTISLLQADALEACYHLIDEHLERIGDPAAYSREPRFSAYTFSGDKIVYLVPDSLRNAFLDASGAKWTRSLEHHRLFALKDLLSTRYPDYHTIPISTTADLVSLPESCLICEHDDLVILGRSTHLYDLPAYVRADAIRAETVVRRYDDLYHEMERKARAEFKVLLLFNKDTLQDFEAQPLIAALKRRIDERLKPEEPDDDDDFDEDEDE